MAIFVENFKTEIFLDFTSSSYLSFFCIKNDNLGLKMKILKFLGIQPYQVIPILHEVPEVHSTTGNNNFI